MPGICYEARAFAEPQVDRKLALRLSCPPRRANSDGGEKDLGTAAAAGPIFVRFDSGMDKNPEIPGRALDLRLN